MRTARAALALLLAFAIPVRAETTTDPLWYLLSTYVLAPDEKAVAVEGEGTLDVKGLAALQSDLLLLSDGFEGFRDEAQVKETLTRLEPRMSPELRPFFKDRASSLDAIYRTLAVTDYTWAQRFPEPPCAPAEARRELLDSTDGLFQTEKGEASPWLVALLGPRAEGKSVAQALDQASSKTKLTATEYENRRARVRKLTLALVSDKAVGPVRSKLYCSRAAAFEDLAGYHRQQEGGTTLAFRAVVQTPTQSSVFVVVWDSRRAAATLIATKAGPILLTDASILQDGARPQLFAYSEKAKPIELTATVVRRDADLGLAVLTYSESLQRPALPLADKSPLKGDLVSAVGHAEVSGLWTKSSGLVTKIGPAAFQTDAAVSSDFSGGPVLNEAGEVAGLLVVRPADTEEGRWPVAVPAVAISRWLDGAEKTAAPAAEAIEDAGTTAILTRTRPSALTETGRGDWRIPNLPPPPPEPRGVCVSNCGGSSSPSRSPSRSYSSYSGSSSSNSGSAELGEALGKLGAVLILEGIPALFRGIGKLFKKKKDPEHKFVDNRRQVAPDVSESPKPPEDPLRPTSIKLSVTRLVLAQGEALQAVATVGFAGKDGSVAGRRVSFTVVPGGKLTCPPGSTDASGIARTTCKALEIGRDQPFDSLQDEVRRKMGMKTPGRVRREPPKSDKVGTLKEKEASAMEALNGEEDKHSGFGTGGSDTPGIDKPFPEIEVAVLEIKGDSVTLGASIDKYQDQATLDILERPCPDGSDIERPTGGSNSYRCRNSSIAPKSESYRSDDSSPPEESAEGEPNETSGQTSPNGTTPQGRPYTHHYGEETGPDRKIPGSVVDSIIETIPPHRTSDGKNVRYDPVNEITVVTGRNGIISVHYGKPRKGQMK